MRVFGTWVKTPLGRFSPKKADEEALAQQELGAAYRANAALFAKALLKPAKR